MINAVEPWMSSEDIEKGSRGLYDIAAQLEDTDYGIVIVTADNFAKPWINFEAGALSRKVAESRVMPVLFRVNYADIYGPLTQFQYAETTQEDMFRLIRSINRLTDRPLSDNVLELSFAKWWPDLEADLTAVPESTDVTPPQRTETDVLSEILALVRGLERASVVKPVQRNVSAHRSSTLQKENSATARTRAASAEFLKLTARRDMAVGDIWAEADNTVNVHVSHAPSAGELAELRIAAQLAGFDDVNIAGIAEDTFSTP